MANAEWQVPGHLKWAYRDAVDNILFLKRQQWLATNYVLLLYAAIFLISAHYFSRTDVARNWLGVITIAAFVIHWWMLHSFQRSIETFRNRLVWVYRTYFSEEERAGLHLPLQPRSYWYEFRGLHWPLSRLIYRSFVDCDLFVVCPMKCRGLVSAVLENDLADGEISGARSPGRDPPLV